MKLIVLKRRDFIHIKRQIGVFVFLFILSLILLFEHFNEEPFFFEEIQTSNNGKSIYPAPDFTLVNLKGNREGLTDYKGGVLLVNLWATWCAPCRLEMRSFEKLYRRYRSQGLTVLAVCIDKGAPNKIKQFVEDRKLSFPVLIDRDGTVERLYPSPTIPATFVIDRKGLVIKKVDGAKNWESDETFKAIEFLLKNSE